MITTIRFTDNIQRNIPKYVQVNKYVECCIYYKGGGKWLEYITSWVHIVIDLLLNLTIDLSWFTAAFLSKNLFRNLSLNITAEFIGYRAAWAAYRNVARVAFLYRDICSTPSENLRSLFS